MTETSKSLQVNRIHNARQAACSCKTFSFRLLVLQMQANAIPDYTLSSEKQELVAAGSPGGAPRGGTAVWQTPVHSSPLLQVKGFRHRSLALQKHENWRTIRWYSLPVHPHQRLLAQVYTSNKRPHLLRGILRAAGLYPQSKTQMNWNDKALKLSAVSACTKWTKSEKSTSHTRFQFNSAILTVFPLGGAS